ncbi:MAG TPA: biotin/lipoyl-binding protein, partial [Pirellulales bacterium]
MIVVGGLGYFEWKSLQPQELPAGFAKSNGRIEAVEIDIAAKIAGRLVSVLAQEGDFVTAGQLLAQMDTKVLQAQLREAEAEFRRAKTNVTTAQSTLTQRQSEKAAADAVVVQHEAELDLAKSNFARTEKLVKTGATTKEQFDTDKAAYYTAVATVSRAKADVAAGDAAISTANSEIIAAEASVGAAQATIERIQADIDDSALRSPCDGRVQFRISQPGEVLSAGGKVLNMV